MTSSLKNLKYNAHTIKFTPQVYSSVVGVQHNHDMMASSDLSGNLI